MLGVKCRLTRAAALDRLDKTSPTSLDDHRAMMAQCPKVFYQAACRACVERRGDPLRVMSLLTVVTAALHGVKLPVELLSRWRLAAMSPRDHRLDQNPSKPLAQFGVRPQEAIDVVLWQRGNVVPDIHGFP